MTKNIIIIILLVLVFVMFVANLNQARKLFQETKKRIKHQLDLTNVIDSQSTPTETTTGPDTSVEPRPGSETEQPATQG